MTVSVFEELLQEIIRDSDNDGDGMVDTGEERDDGNRDDTDGNAAADAALEEWFSRLNPLLER